MEISSTPCGFQVPWSHWGAFFLLGTALLATVLRKGAARWGAWYQVALRRCIAMDLLTSSRPYSELL